MSWKAGENTRSMSDRSQSGADTPAREYRVLARQYRPRRFADLIGQDVLVQTLTNALSTGRLAHAFLLTGVRGVGKTTTARLIARALNCLGEDGARTDPAVEPCGVCANCVQIAADRHPDVLEMDAASRTGVDDIRELIDSVRYAPSDARFKVYVIDEVHMLSVNAFNALLKTLEEPPEYVKFVFATTEPRKLPVTVVSRCQRYDLRRVDSAQLAAHFAAIAKREDATVEREAIDLIARAADGSVRDGLSLLDQAIGQAAGEPVTESAVRGMLGLADRAQLFDLYEAVAGGRLPDGLANLAALYQAGADPATLLQDLLEIVHWLTRLKIVPGDADDPGLSPDRRRRGAALAESLPLSGLTRDWQILLKGLQETHTAPNPIQAAEMVLIRLGYAAQLPSPADLIKQLTDSPADTPQGRPPAGAEAAPDRSTSRRDIAPASPEPAATPVRENDTLASPRSFEEVVAMFARQREALLQAHLTDAVHLVRFEPGRIELRPTADAPKSLAGEVASRLSQWTGERWLVVVSGEPGAPTLAEARDNARAQRIAEAERDPAVQRILSEFPDARVTEVRETPAGPDLDEPETPSESGDRTG